MAGEKDMYTEKYGKYIRHYKENGWTYEKYSRMAVYVFLYNKVRGMPKSFGFSNDDVSWRFNEYIRDHFEELCAKYNIQDHIKGFDMTGDHFDEKGNKVTGGKTLFMNELNEYAEYATTLAGLDAKPDEKGTTKVRMPSDDTIIGLFEALKINRKSHFENIRANVKKDSGYNVDKDGKNKIGRLRAERYTVKKKIQDQKREMRESAFFGIMHGLGFAAFGTVAVASAVLIFSPATILGAGVALASSALGTFGLGLTGLIVGGSLAAGAGRRFLNTAAKFFGQFMHLRQHLIHQRGESGKGRGIKDIDKDIALNEAVKYAYNLFGNMVKEKVYFKRKEKQGENDLDAGKMLDKDGNIIAFGPNNELTAADGSKYIFDEKKLTLTAVGVSPARVIKIGMQGKITENGKEIDIPGLQVPYVETIKKVPPSKKDFEAAIRKHPDKKIRKILAPLAKADESESELGKLYDRANERWGYLYGIGYDASNFVSTYKTYVEDNSEIVLEREDFYNKMFNIHFEGDVANPDKPPIGLDIDESKIDFTKYPAFDPANPNHEMTYTLDFPITDFVQALNELEQDKEKYKQHKEEIKYQHYVGRASDMMPVIFQRELFSKALNGFTLRNCETLLTNKQVKNALENNYTGDKTSYVKAAIRFIQFEHLDPVNPVRTDIGVNVEAQFYTKATDIEEACVKFFGTSKSSPEWGDIQNITTQIENMDNKEQAKSIRTLIDSLTDVRVKKYLSSMVDKKENQTIHSKNYVINDVIGSDRSLASDPDIIEFSEMLTHLKYDPTTDTFSGVYNGVTYTENDVREFITNRLNGSTDKDLCNRAEKLLNTQCGSLERAYMDGIRGKAAKAVSKNEMSTDIEPLITYIEGLKFENLGSDELIQFLVEKVNKVQPAEIKDYLRMKLRTKIEQIYTVRFGQGGIYTGENAIKDLTVDLQKLELMSGILGNARKERILKGFEPKIAIAFDRMLTLKEVSLFEMDDPNKFREEIRNIIMQTYEGGGFKQYFNRNSDASNKVLSRLSKMSTLISYTDYLNGTGQGGISVQSDKKVPESKIFLGLYFAKDRPEGDKLLDTIKELNTLMRDVNFNKFHVEDGQVHQCGSELEKLRKFLNNTSPVLNINSVDDGPNPVTNAAEQIALLLIYKRKVMALFKSHLKKLTYGKPDIQAYVRSAEGQKVIGQIKAQWQPLLEDIDKKYADLVKIASVGGYKDILSGYAYKNATTTMDAAFAENNIMTYVLSENSVVMEK